MERGLVITLPKSDDATEYLSYYSKFIIEEAESKSIKIKPIKDNEVIMTIFNKIMNSLDYRMVVFNGHGSSDSIFGYRNEILIKFGQNDKLLNERIIYARACDAGLILGKEITKGTKEGVFIGYNLPFVFIIDEKWSSKPANDNLARLFLEPSNLVPISILKGNSALEANNSSKRQILKNLSKVLRANLEPETPFIAGALWNNYFGQVLHGNQEARL